MTVKQDNSAYLGNPNLKSANVAIDFTEEQIGEYMKCSQDPVYFIKNYVKIVNLNEGLVPFELYDFQEKFVNTIHNNRFVISKFPRQSGKSTTVIAYLLHMVLFNPNQNVAILANKLATARELLHRLKLAYEHLPKWIQQGVITWNKGSIELENGSKILASATSSSAVRGASFNCILLDEFAYVPFNIADEFFSSVYPTISSGKTTKVIIVSTPKGMNMYYKLWTDSVNGRNEYVPVEVFWDEVLVVTRHGKNRRSRTPRKNNLEQNSNAISSARFTLLSLPRNSRRLHSSRLFSKTKKALRFMKK